MDTRTSRASVALIDAIDTALASDDALPSITEICSIAGVSRPTFYQHFGDIATLVATAGISRLQQLFDEVSGASPESDWHTTAPRLVQDLLTKLFAEATYFQRVLEASGTHDFQERVVEFITNRLLHFTPLRVAGDDTASEEELTHRKRTAVFLAAGATWLVVLWVRMRSGRPSPETAAAEVSQLIISSITAQRSNA